MRIAWLSLSFSVSGIRVCSCVLVCVQDVRCTCTTAYTHSARADDVYACNVVVIHLYTIPHNSNMACMPVFVKSFISIRNELLRFRLRSIQRNNFRKYPEMAPHCNARVKYLEMLRTFSHQTEINEIFSKCF